MNGSLRVQLLVAMTAIIFLTCCLLLGTGGAQVSGTGATQQPSQPTAAPTPTPRVNNGALPIVSSDGLHIAFSSNRGGAEDLFVISAGGAGEVQLTHTPEAEGAVQWTGDGKHVLFSIFTADTSHLYSIDLDGKNQHEIARVPGRSPMLSPDGKRLLYMAGTWTATRLMVSALDGSDAQQINDNASIAWNNHWSPDGNRIAFTGQDAAKSELAVFVMKADGTERRHVTHIAPEEGGAQWPVWSPDGGQLAVQVNSRTKKGSAHIWTVDVATGEAHKLAAHDQPYLDETPSWFPDGKRIAFQSNRTGRMEVWVMNADGSGQRQMTHPRINGGGPKVSHDGTRIAFFSDRDGHGSIRVIGSDGTGERTLVPSSDGIGIASWGNNDRQLILTVRLSRDSTVLRAIDLDGANPTELATIPGRGAAFSPDGRLMAFPSSKPTGAALTVSDADGTKPKELTDGKSVAYFPSWSPDGRRIAFAQFNPGKSKPRIWLINADGTGLRQLPDLAESDASLEAPRWSPDGKQLAVQVGRYNQQSPQTNTASICLIDIETGAIQTIAPHATPYLDETSYWFPDGKRIAFQSDRTGRMEVWVMNADGSEQRQITR